MVPESFYRVSIKGLFVNDGRVLLCQEEDGRWELPGGGPNFGESIEEALRREIKEEMGLIPALVEKKPIYAWTLFDDVENVHRIFIGYRIVLDSLDFQASEECVKIGFYNPEEIKKLNLHPNIQEFSTFFNPQDFH